MTETVAAATGQDNPGAVSEHDVNALAAHQVRLESFTQIQILNSERYVWYGMYGSTPGCLHFTSSESVVIGG